MSFMHRTLLTSKLPPKSSSQPRRRGKHDFTPVSWKKYFENKRDVVINGNSFRIYTSGDKGPLLVFLHGGGFSALSWALLSSMLCEMVECQILAMDLRGHGDTITQNDEDLSIETLSSDVVDVINHVHAEMRPVILIGHSLGGSIAVHAAHNSNLSSLNGIVVIDVVEGTALGALSSMQSILRGRPQSFNSIEDAIKWSVQSGQLKNIESAKISMPGQLKNSKTNKPATTELENEIVEGSLSELPHPRSNVESIAEDEEATFKPPDVSNGKYSWRIDLRSTENHWPGWFQGLSKLFLSTNVQKLLLLASLDRLDTDLTVAHMQGKFEVHAFEQSRGHCGHVIHEDIPDAVAEVFSTYLVRNKFAQPKSNFEVGSMPCC
ncbi:unnamed protein product [Nezara viridula]|uniref:Protein phosphatase methylesterase 1 n=1 Tax=Nezara viridula TaxID=85310 RepID=A0A9P0E2E9_NEZVI|nr:unnamed protein product [Nezara viridula]